MQWTNEGIFDWTLFSGSPSLATLSPAQKRKHYPSCLVVICEGDTAQYEEWTHNVTSYSAVYKGSPGEVGTIITKPAIQSLAVNI